MGASAFASGVDAQEDEKQERETPKRRAAVGKERQRDADDGGDAQHHADVDEHVEEQDRKHRIAEHAPEGRRLPLGQGDEPPDE